FFMFDIDNFKEINDMHGHMFGNAVLAMVADKLRNAINGYGIAARWGGDEFIGILAVEPMETRRIISQFMDALRNEKKDNGLTVTVSVGIIEINEKFSMEQVVKKADEVMYYSKENGRDRITFC
ncbi:MAG TPA: GGDEF domain-containing protein, partial [Firmicutes bacterium]|nr:GGDEF domain-containing protein [Bacillota bacterium]